MDNVSIEIAPLIDIVFILLIFFVVTSTFIKENVLELELPTAESSTIPSPQESIDILISMDNEIHVNNEPLVVSDRATLKARLESLQADHSYHLVIRADARSTHETVVLAMDVAQTLGLTKIRVVTLKDSRG